MIEVVYFFGDSFVAGFGDPAGHGWIGRVQESAPAELRFTAVNRGVPGATSAQSVRDWQDAAERLMADDTSGAGVVFSFGTNDVIEGMPPGQTCETLSEALALAAAIGMPALVVGPPPILGMPREQRLLAALAGELALIRAMHGAVYVDAHDELLASPVWTSEIADGDGSHPQTEGYATLANLVIEAGFFNWLAGRDREGPR